MILTISSSQSRAYDYAGNRVSQGSQSIANLLLENSTHKFVPDAFGTGSLAQKVDRASGAAENFAYRADQKLLSYSRNGIQAEYFYDALGRRVAKKVTKGSDQAFTQSYVYLGEEDKILLGKAGDGEITVYLDGQGIDEHLGEVSSRGVKAYATDHLGSVLNGDAAGVAKAFGAWGENISSSAPTITATSSPVAYGFTGRQLDPESGTYYYRARTYLPDVGRFAQADPIGFDAGDANLHRYVWNNPLSYRDPSGNGAVGLAAFFGCSAYNTYQAYSTYAEYKSQQNRVLLLIESNLALQKQNEQPNSCSKQERANLATISSNTTQILTIESTYAQTIAGGALKGFALEAICLGLLGLPF
ncbi:MAG: hypothetical protein A2X94_03195 [Bdellovibrionales bacterium GWB1_55_8]|nr:MAG: hypothetical protein A2X94_03195 [Bdellovibrionales bacterium GWB1_55_8]